MTGVIYSNGNDDEKIIEITCELKHTFQPIENDIEVETEA